MKFILMKIRINLINMEVYAQPIQNLWLRPLKSGYFRVALTLSTVANFSPEHSGTEKDQRGYPLCLKSQIFIFIMKSLLISANSLI